MLNTDRLCLGCMNDNGGEAVCRICGYDSSTPNPQDALPAKFWLSDRYLIGRVLHTGGQGITYIGWDNVENSIVHVLEYFPAGIALRNPDRTVTIAENCKYAFNEGLLDFLELHRKLSGSELPALTPVKSSFEENGTGYAVCGVPSGITLKEFLERNGGRLRWEQARPLFLPLLDTVAGLHAAGIVHGGISSESVMVGRDGKLRLSDPTIRQVRDSASDFKAELYDGFAALEQYGEPETEFSAQADIYALCATLFHVLIGTVPPAATARANQDSLSIPAHITAEMPRHVLVALANGLQIRPESRTASMETFKNELVYGETAEQTVAAHGGHAAAASSSAAAAKTATAAKKEKGSSGAKYAIISAACTAGAFLLIAAVLALTVFRSAIFGNPNDTASKSSGSHAERPDVSDVGEYDPDAVESAKTYTVPNFVGNFYSQVIENEEYENFNIVIKDKAFSDKYPKGAICEQTVATGTEVEKSTTVEVVISLGPKEIRIANVVGLTEAEAKLELLKQGFLYENIEVSEKYDSDATPGVVLEQSPESRSVTNTEVIVRIYVNSYTGEN